MTSCTSGVYACNSNALQVCNQNSWETILQCDASLNQYCQASPYYNCAGSSSTGTATCTNGQYFCLDNALQVCLNGSNVTILHCDSSQGQVCRSNPYYDCFGSTTITLTTATTQISTKTTTTKTIAKTTSKTTKTTTTTQTTTTTTTTSTTTTTTTNTSTTTSSNKYKLITYWGQDSGYYTNGQLQTSLYSYCATGFFDVINLAFLYQFGGTTPADFQLDLSNYGSYSYIGGVASGSFANDVGADIIACQNLGVKVLLSLGGGVGAYSVPSGSGTAIGQMLHNSFFGGSSSARPFGSAVLNGIDWDIEASGSSQSDIVAVNQYLHANNENLDISGAPQCPYPDAYLGGSIAMANSGYTFLNVQFYNNYCNLANGQFNFDTWATSMSSLNIPIAVGIPGSSESAPAGGYVSASVVQSQLSAIVASATDAPWLYGVMTWDASSTAANNNFGDALRTVLNGL